MLQKKFNHKKIRVLAQFQIEKMTNLNIIISFKF